MQTLDHFRRDARREAPVLRRLERRQNIGFILLLVIFTPLFLLPAAVVIPQMLVGPLDVLPAAAQLDSVTEKDLLVSLGGTLLAVLMIATTITLLVARQRAWRRSRAAAEIGQKYGWHYQLEQGIGGFGGTLFRTGNYGILQDTLHIHEPRFAEVGNFSYTLGPRLAVGYVALEMPRTVPHMYLASVKTQKKPRAYDIPFTPSQKLSLEGNFDRFFTLYCPKEYERDALYVFTPDLMAMMIDQAEGFDVEIVDRWLFVIAREPFDMTSEDVLRMTQTFNQTLGDLTERQTTRYVDERSTEPWRVGQGGRRLQDRRVLIRALVFSTVAWAIGAAVALIYAKSTGVLDQLPW